MSLRCCAVLCVHDEAAHLPRVLEDLTTQGIDVAVIDHGSTDGSDAILRRYVGRGLVHLQELDWHGEFDLTRQLEAKRSLIATLDHDWVVHCDADEWMHTRVQGETLKQGIERLAGEGFNAINFEEFVFLPAPDSPEPTDLRRGLLDYYFFAPAPRRLMRAWARSQGFSNVGSGGHLLAGSGLRPAPENFVLRHYIVRSQAHAIEKYARRVFAAGDLANGWHGNRQDLDPAALKLPDRACLMHLSRWDKAALDRSQPRTTHFWQWQREDCAP